MGTVGGRLVWREAGLKYADKRSGEAVRARTRGFCSELHRKRRTTLVGLANIGTRATGSGTAGAGAGITW